MLSSAKKVIIKYHTKLTKDDTTEINFIDNVIKIIFDQLTLILNEYKIQKKQKEKEVREKEVREQKRIIQARNAQPPPPLPVPI